AALQAVAVRRAPPFALVVVDAARVEEQVSADRGDAAMRRTGYRAGGLRDRAVAADEQRMRGERRQAGSRADRHPRARALDGVEARDAAEVDEHFRPLDAAAQVRYQVGSAGDESRVGIRGEQRRG